MTHGVERRLLVELAAGLVDDDGGVQRVRQGRAAMFVQGKVPVEPGTRPVLEVLEQLYSFI